MFHLTDVAPHVVVGVEPYPDLGQTPKLVVVESVEEEPTHVGVMPTPGTPQHGSAGRGQDSGEDPPVAVRLPSLDELATLEPIGEPGESAGGHQAPFGQKGHAQPAATGDGKLSQHVVLGHAELKRGQPGLQFAPDAVHGW